MPNLIPSQDLLDSLGITSRKWLTVFAEKLNDGTNEVTVAAIAAAINATLQDITEEGNITTEDIVLDEQAKLILKDLTNTERGFIAGDEYFGAAIVGSSDGSNFDEPVAIKGSSTVLLSDILGLKFNGAESGNFMRVLAPQTLENGDTVFPISTTALDVVEYDETFTDNMNVELTSSFQTIIQGTATNQYRIDTAQAETFFLIENTDNQSRTIEYAITKNDAAPTVPEIFTVVVSKNQTLPVTGTDTVSTDNIEIGETVELKVRCTNGTPNIRGDQNTSILKLVQNASIQNAIQGTSGISSNSTLDINRLNEVTGGTVFNLPDLNPIFSPSIENLLAVQNQTGGDITINTTGGNDIYDERGDGQTSRIISNGETYTFFAISATKWGISGSNKLQATVARTGAMNDLDIAGLLNDGNVIFNTGGGNVWQSRKITLADIDDYVEPFYECIDSINYTRAGQTTEGLINNTTTPEDYLTLVFTPQVDGIYRITCFYEWSLDATNQDFIATVELYDDTPSLVGIISMQEQEPADSGGGGISLNTLSGGVIGVNSNTGTSQKHPVEVGRDFMLIGGTEYTAYLRWTSTDVNDMATIYTGNLCAELKKAT